MYEIQELGRRSSKILKNKFLDSYKKFLKIYWKCSKTVNIKHSNWYKRSSGNGVNIFWKRIKESFIVECKKFKIWEEEFLKWGKRSSETQRKSFEIFIQDVLKLWI